MAGIGVLGGIGKGILQGSEEWRRQNQEDFDQNQRARTIRLQNEQDQMRNEMKGITPAGTTTNQPVQYTYADPNETEPDGLDAARKPVMQTGTYNVQKTRSGGDYLADVSKVYSRYGLPNEAMQADQGARSARIQDAQDQIVRIAGMVSTGKMTKQQAVAQLGAMYDQVPDGYMLRHRNVNGQDMIVIDHDASGTTEAAPLNDQNFQALIQRAMQFTSPEQYAAGQQLGLKQREVAAQEVHAAAAMRNAQTTEQQRKDQSVLYPAQAEMMRAHAEYYRRMLAAANAKGAAVRMAVQVPDQADPRKKVKMDVLVSRDANGNVKYSDAQGNDVSNNPRIMQALQGATEDQIINEQHDSMAAGYRDAAVKNNIPPNELQKTLGVVEQMRNNSLMEARARRDFLNADQEGRRQIILTMFQGGMKPVDIAAKLNTDVPVVQDVIDYGKKGLFKAVHTDKDGEVGIGGARYGVKQPAKVPLDQIPADFRDTSKYKVDYDPNSNDESGNPTQIRIRGKDGSLEYRTLGLKKQQ